MPIRILGPLTVDGVEPARLGGRRQQAVLAALALRMNSPAARDSLIEGIWDNPPPHSVSSLQGYICHLREALRGSEFIIEFASGSYVLAGPPGALDAERFDEEVSLAQPLLLQGQRSDLKTAEAHLRRGLRLWFGEPLQGMADMPLLRVEARRLAERRVEAETELLRCRLDLGEDSSLVADIEHLVAQNPYDEEPRALLVIALYRAGRQADALRTFRRARLRLTAELGLDPGFRLAALERMVLLHDPRLLGSDILRPHQLPDPEVRSGPGTRLSKWGREPAGSQGSLVCRIEEMARLASLLLRRRLVTVLGPPGIGKSRLVSEYRRATSGPDDGGDWIEIELGPLRDEPDLLREVARRCDLEPGPATAERLSAALFERDSILVFDGAEHLAPPLAALCEHMLEACPRLSLLVTSRQALGLDAEATLELGPLSLPEVRPFDRQAMLRSAAVALFLDKACPGADSSEVADDDLVAAAQICRELDGVPLALELAGATARALPWSDVRDELAAGLREMAVEGTGSAAVLAPLAAAIESSYQMLTPEQQRLLCALSVFEGAFDLCAVRAAAGGDEKRAFQTAGLLAQLVGCSLVARDRGPSQQPYRLLAPVRHFVRSRTTADQAGSGDAHGRRGDHRLRRVG